jgi:hypothetical protein
VGGKVKVTAKWNGDPVHIDTIDLNSAPQRKRFAKEVNRLLPMAKRDAVEAELVRLADSSLPPETLGDPIEIDLETIVRPEQFYSEEVAGLAVAAITNEGGLPVSKYWLYLRWADGSRERRNLSNVVELAGGRKLWVHPTPGDPPVNVAPTWSSSARQRWLNGSTEPSPASVFRSLCEAIARFIDFPTETAPGTVATLALWVILTYCYRAWGAVPYLYVGGPLQSGKSRLFDVLSRVVFRPLMTANLTAPAMFRTLNDRGGTVLFDEAERLRQATPEVQEVLSMFLAGYKRGGTATRLDKVGDGYRTVQFDVYGPKALACIAGLPPTLSSRCIQVMMCRAGVCVK